MRCESCGANLPPLTPVCTFCKATTSVGTHQAAQKAAWEQQQAAHAAHVHHQTQQQREYLLRQRAQKLTLWGIGSLFCPCLGIPAIATFFVALGVRNEAKRSNLPVPGQVTTAFVLSGISFAISVGLVILSIVTSAEHEEHVADLERRSAPLLTKATLTQPEACLLAEYFVERDGHGGVTGLNIEGFRCDGKLFTRGPEKLLLEKLQFKHSSKVHDVDLCFQRRARWTLDRIVPTGTSCDAPPEEAASAQANPSASGASAPPGSADKAGGKKGTGLQNGRD